MYYSGYHSVCDVGELTLGWLDHSNGIDRVCNAAEELLRQKTDELEERMTWSVPSGSVSAV